MDSMKSTIATLGVDEAGVTAIEYGLIAALIAVAIIGAVSATGDSLGAMYDKWTDAVIAAIS
jgi:pilus assembly protein Flp/PilA